MIPQNGYEKISPNKLKYFIKQFKFNKNLKKELSNHSLQLSNWKL